MLKVLFSTRGRQRDKEREKKIEGNGRPSSTNDLKKYPLRKDGDALYNAMSVTQLISNNLLENTVHCVHTRECQSNNNSSTEKSTELEFLRT